MITIKSLKEMLVGREIELVRFMIGTNGWLL